MIAPLAKFIDWCGLQAAAAFIISARKCDRGNTKLTEAVEFLNGPDFIPVESKPAKLEFTSDIHFKFPSPRPCEFAENNVVHGRLYRCANAGPERPVIVLLHGGGNFPGHQLRLQLLARHCHRAGLNAATLELPYHFQRRVRRIESFHHLHTAEAFAQAVAEIRALTGWLLGQGWPSVALFGVSLGGWLAGLTATRDSRLNAIVMAVPGVCMNYRVARGERILWTPVRKALERQKTAREALDMTPINLTLSQPIIPKDHILLIQGRYDLFVEAEHTEKLWQKWRQPEIWRLPHGHISGLIVPGLTNRVLGWLEPRLDADNSK
ncbi:MAG: alpha/beta hydrolase family protein [Verrucomicrobiota bacterium]|jgi:dienelactone hydrolase